MSDVDIRFENHGELFVTTENMSKEQVGSLYKINKKFHEQQAEIERLRAALLPFALYAAVYGGRDDVLTAVLQHEQQSLCVGALLAAKRVLELGEKGGGDDVQ